MELSSTFNNHLLNKNTYINLRWIAIIGQFITINTVSFILKFEFNYILSNTVIFFGVIFSIYIEKIRLFLSLIFNISLFPEEIYFLSKMPSEINIDSILIIAICSILITIIVSIYPAKNASKQDLIKSLKYE